MAFIIVADTRQRHGARRTVRPATTPKHRRKSAPLSSTSTEQCALLTFFDWPGMFNTLP